MRMTASLRGFTLVEMAVVLVIVGLMLGGLIVPLTTQMEQKGFTDTQRAMAEIKEALMGYALSHAAADTRPYFPCPDTDGNGLENREVGGGCTNTEGDLPWADLGVSGRDAWNNLYRYRVANGFSNSVNGFLLTSNGNITVKDASAGANIATNVPALVISRGKAGAGGGADEAENTDVDGTFVSHTPSGAAGNEFDDMVVWLPSAIIVNRMAVAGRLP